MPGSICAAVGGRRIGREGSGHILKKRRDEPSLEDRRNDRLARSRAGHPRRVVQQRLARRSNVAGRRQLHTADQPFGDGCQGLE